MAVREGTLSGSILLPSPWPPHESKLLMRGYINGIALELKALNDGRITVTCGDPEPVLISQPVAVQLPDPSGTVSTLITASISDSEIKLFLGAHRLQEYASGVAVFVIAPDGSEAIQESALDHPDKEAVCKHWIQYRKVKFGTPRTPRADRRLKTPKELGHDLLSSIHRLGHLAALIRAGNEHLLGTLAGEIRASVFWPRSRESKPGPDRDYSPLLLRMASMADLPLPVFILGKRDAAARAILDRAEFIGGDAPRVDRWFLLDEVCDVQEALIKTAVRLGAAPGRQMSGLDLIKELANTMGAAHYDEDASEFLDVLATLEGPEGDQVTTFICQIADTLAVLSDSVFSELTKRNFIG